MTANVTVVGNITQEPELRYTQSGAAMVKFGLAVNRPNPKDTGKAPEVDFFDVVGWRELGEHVSESLTKGTRVIVTGRLQQERWETDGGQKRSKVGITADEIGPSLRWATASVTKVDRQGVV